MNTVAGCIVGLSLGWVIGDVSYEWWRTGRRRNAVRLNVLLVAVVVAGSLILAGCSSPPLDVRPPIARVS